jgi:hypothetical protein
MTDEPSSDLERAARQDQASSVWIDLAVFLWQNKSWWLIPVVLALGLLGVLVVLAGSAGAAFIYTLF